MTVTSKSDFRVDVQADRAISSLHRTAQWLFLRQAEGWLAVRNVKLQVSSDLSLEVIAKSGQYSAASRQCV